MKLADNFFSSNAVANTSDIQDAINYSSYSMDRVVELPAGLIPFTRLFFYYDPILNPGYNPNLKQGLVILQGAGTLDIGYSINKNYSLGTMLKSNYTGSGAVISLGSAALGHNTSPYKTRKSSLRDISIISNNPGFVVEAQGNPEMDWERVVIVQEHENGSGLLTGSFWFGKLDKTFIINNSINTKTGTGISFYNGTNGGLFSLDKSLIDGFYTGIKHESDSMFFSNVNITNSAIQKCENGIDIASRLVSLNIEKSHFEGCNTDVITSANIDSLSLNEIYVSGRNGKSNPNLVLDGGIRILNARNINLRDGQSDYIQLGSNTSSINNFVDMWGVNYFHGSPGTINRPITSISNNGNGKCRVRINSHNYLTGRKVVLKNTPYDGEYLITVIDNNNIDLDTSTYSATYVSGGTCSLLCHAIRNMGGIPLDNINIKAMVCSDFGVDFIRGIH